MKKLSAYFLFFSLCLLTFSSCASSDNSDDSDDETEAPQGTFTTASGVKVLSYDKFLNTDDVIIEDADTNSISVSSAYLKSINTTINAGDVVCIWLNINEPPFIRKVTSVSSTTRADAIAFQSTSGDIGDVIDDANVNLSSEIYYNQNGQTASEQFNDGTDIHPAAIIYRYVDENGNVGKEGAGIDVKDLIKENPQAPITRGTWHIIDQTFLTDMSILPSNAVSVGISNGNTHIYSEFNVKFSVKKAKLKNFHAIFKGGIQMHLPLTVTATAPLLAFDRELTIFRFPQHHFVYWIGPVPIDIVTEPSVVADFTGGVDAQVSLTLPVNFGVDFKFGPTYSRSDGWGVESDFTTNHSVETENASASVALDAHVGIGLMFKTGVYIYGCAGPYAMIGPAAEVHFTASPSKPSNGKTPVNLTLGVNLVGKVKVGAELKALRWRLAYWEKTWDLASWTLWNKNWTVYAAPPLANSTLLPSYR
jgi:hypothetical protein